MHLHSCIFRFKRKEDNIMNKSHKPKSPIIGADGNIFNLVAIASKTLNTNGFVNEAQEMSKRVYTSSSYEEALQIITEYVEPVDVNEALDDHNLYNDFGLEIE